MWRCERLPAPLGEGACRAGLLQLSALCGAGASWGASVSLGPPLGQFLPFLAVAAAMLATQVLYRFVALPGV